jgi:hypothetical protein
MPEVWQADSDHFSEHDLQQVIEGNGERVV